MTVQLRANLSCVRWGCDLWKDSPACVVEFEEHRKAHPYELTEGNYVGQTILTEAMGRGNVSMVSHLVLRMDKTQINMWSASGYTIFEGAMLYDNLISKIVECTRIVLNAGGDINLANAQGIPPLDALIARVSPYGWACKVLPLIKLYIRAGAHTPKGHLSEESIYLKAQTEIFEEDWLKIRNIYIGSVDPGSSFNQLPQDIQHLITQAFNALPDIAQPPLL